MGTMRMEDLPSDLSEQEVDQIVITQATDDVAWEKPIRVRRTRPTSVSISAELAARAAFLARLHRKANVEEWLRDIIEERVALEETVYNGVKQELAAKVS